MRHRHLKKYCFSLAAVCFLLCSALPASAIEKIEVQGLFANKAVLLIDEKRHILAVGQTSPEGVKLISAHSKAATLEVDGVRKEYQLGNTVGTTFATRQTKKETVFIDSGGMYTTFGSINGRTVRFLIDTGAGAISMNSEQAKQLGIRYDKIGVESRVSTASGFAKAYQVRLKTVSLGNITERNVQAFVIEGSHPGPILLGMTFLGRMDIEHSGSAMTIKQK